MNAFIISVNFLVALCAFCYAQLSCKTHATMLRQLDREGFHLDIHSLVEILFDVEDSAKWENCTLVLRENIPNSFYVNPDQLSELHLSGFLHACTLDRVDVESPQYLSDRHTLFVYGRFKKSHNLIYSNLKFPLHVRYQKPKYGGGYSVAELKLPTLLVHCENTNDCGDLMKSKAPCFYCSSELCNWMRIPYKTNAPNFTLPVPVGNLDHLGVVTVVTYLLTFGGFLLSLRAFAAGNFVLRKSLKVLGKEKEEFSNMTFHEKRHFDNPFPDFAALREKQENHIIDPESKKIHPKFLEQLSSVMEKLLRTLEQHLPNGKKDGSVYTGTGGIALLYFVLSEKMKNPIYLEKATDLIENSLARMKNRDISFLCGDAGPLAIGAVIFRRQGRSERSKECVSQLLDFVPSVINTESQIPDELLYGRVGYLYSLLFVNKYIPGVIRDSYLTQVISAVIISGRNLSKRESLPVPLMYEWYGDFYLGGAHGLAGIIYLILQIVNAVVQSGKKIAVEEKLKAPLIFEWHNKKYLGGAHGTAGILYLLLQCKEHLTCEQLEMIKGTIDFLLGLRYPSGNFPSSLGSNADRLVHWCHGAPGTVQMLCAAYKAFGDERYLRAAEVCGDVVWERGLLRKGYGICHGVAGNAYTFLILYQLTNQVEHLYRACKFAEWCLTYNEYQERPPDRPYSLFEGLAGTIYFLNDIQQPLQAKFPCFTV